MVWRSVVLTGLIVVVLGGGLEGDGRTFSIAVMTDGDPTMQYGIDTIQGAGAALLR